MTHILWVIFNFNFCIPITAAVMVSLVSWLIWLDSVDCRIMGDLGGLPVTWLPVEAVLSILPRVIGFTASIGAGIEVDPFSEPNSSHCEFRCARHIWETSSESTLTFFGSFFLSKCAEYNLSWVILWTNKFWNALFWFT